MISRFPFLLLPFFVFACAQKAADTIASSDSIPESEVTSTIGGDDATLTDSTAAPSGGREVELTSIYLPVKDRGRLLLEMNYLERVVYVFREDDIMHEIQKLGPVETDMDFSEARYSDDPEEIFNPEDLNFDGYKDLKILTSQGTGGSWFAIYLFDPRTGLFEFNIDATALASLRADSVTRKLHSHDIGGMAGAFYTHQILHWNDVNLVLERREDQESADADNQDVFIRTVLLAGSTGALDTAAVVRIRYTEERDRWCLIKGDWEALQNSPHPPENVVKTDGREGGCGF